MGWIVAMFATSATIPPRKVLRHHAPAPHAAARPAFTKPALASVTRATRLASGMVIHRDPETGGISSPEPASYRELSVDELQALAKHEADGLVTVHNADGSDVLRHQRRFADYLIVRRGADGRPVFECVAGDGLVRHALDPKRPLASAKSEER
jgi:hypothetical protein